MCRALATIVILTLALGACQSDFLCPQDDPPALGLIVRDLATGVRLDGVSGTVTSRSYTRPVMCYTFNGQEACHGWAREGYAAIHLERLGSLPWDTTGVQIAYTGDDCGRPIERDIEVRMQSTP